MQINFCQFINLQLVVANLLQNREARVIIVTPSEQEVIEMTNNEIKSGKEIEEQIVSNIIKKHQGYYG